MQPSNADILIIFWHGYNMAGLQHEILESVILYCLHMFLILFCHQGRTDPMGIRTMPWGPPPKGARQTSKNNANQQKFVMRNAQFAFDNSKKHCQEEDSGQLSLWWRPWAQFGEGQGGTCPPNFLPQGDKLVSPLLFYPHAIFFNMPQLTSAWLGRSWAKKCEIHWFLCHSASNLRIPPHFLKHDGGPLSVFALGPKGVSVRPWFGPIFYAKSKRPPEVVGPLNWGPQSMSQMTICLVFAWGLHKI